MTPNQFSSKVAAMSRAGSLLPTLMARAGQTSLQFFLDNFDRQGTKDERFVPWKARKYQVNHRLLHDTGKLREGFTVKLGGAKGFTITNDVPYAAYHEDGTATLPRRTLLYESKQLEKQLTQDITNSLKGLFK